MAELSCPRCAAPRTENFRWCRKCGLDFHKPPKVIVPDPGVGAAIQANVAVSAAPAFQRPPVQSRTSQAPRPTPSREWRVKYDGPCADCATMLPKGTVASWDRAQRKLRCLSCASATTNPALSSVDLGVAGRSARAKYDALIDGHDGQIQAQYGARLGGWVLRFSNDPHSIRAWGIGAAGEEALAAAFDGQPDLWMLHDRAVRGTKGNIDHILVAPAGVFVVDAKNYAGTVELRNSGFFRPVPRLFVGGRERSKSAEGLAWQVSAVRGALAHADLPSMPPITGVLCFVSARWPRFGRPREFEGVRLDSPESLKSVLTGPAGLEPESVERIVRVLAELMPPR